MFRFTKCECSEMWSISIWRMELQRKVPSTHLAKWRITINTTYTRKGNADENVHVCNNTELLIRRKKRKKKKRRIKSLRKMKTNVSTQRDTYKKEKRNEINEFNENTFEANIEIIIFMQESRDAPRKRNDELKSEIEENREIILTKKNFIWKNLAQNLISNPMQRVVNFVGAKIVYTNPQTRNLFFWNKKKKVLREDDGNSYCKIGMRNSHDHYLWFFGISTGKKSAWVVARKRIINPQAQRHSIYKV